MSYTYYNSSAASMGAYMKYRARLGIDTSDGTESTAVIKWIGAAQSTQISGWGIKIAVSSSGDTSGYSGSKSGSDTGVVSSSTNFETDAKTSGTLKIPRGHSEKTVTITATVSGTTVNGHTGVTAGSESVSHKISIKALDKYTIKYDFNGGEGTCDNQTKWYGETLTLRKGDYLTRSGYKLVCWNTTSSGSGTSYQLGGSYTKNAGDTLYAIWEPRTYTISFNSNGGSSISTTIKVIYNSTYGNMPTPTRTGYTFAGWYTSQTGGTKITSSTKVTIAGNDTLYAHWTINNYTLTANANGGTIPTTSGWTVASSGTTATKSITFNSTYGTLPTPARTGYTFTGWYTSETGGSQVSSSTTMGAGNRTIFARWQIKTYPVNYDANGGSNPPATQTKTYGVNLTLSSSIPTLSGYNFTRWNTESGGTGTDYFPGQVYSDNAQLTLHAQWEVAHQTPRITNLNIIRVDEQNVENDEGVYGRTSFNYAFDSSVSAGTAFIEYKTSSSSSYNQADSITLNNNTGSISNVLTKTENNETTKVIFSQDEAYNIRISIKDSDQYSSQNSSTFLSKAYFIMDVYGQTLYNEVNTSSGFPTGITVYEHSYKSIEVAIQPAIGTIAFQDTEQTNGRDLFYSQYYLKENYTFTYLSADNKWYNEDSVSVELNEIGLSYTGDTPDDNSTFTIKIVYNDYVVTEDGTPVSNKHYFKQATEPGHGIAFGVPAEYNKFKIGLPVYLPTNMGIYGVNNSNQNVITIPMIQSVTDSSNYVKIGSNNYATHILGSTINVSGATTLSNTLTVSGATQINNILSVSGATSISSDLKLTKTHSIYLNSGDSSPKNKTRIVAADYSEGNNIYYDAHGYHALRTWDATLATPDWKGRLYIYHDHITSYVPIYINNHSSRIGSAAPAFDKKTYTQRTTSDTDTLGEIELSPGDWVLKGWISFPAGDTAGRRRVWVTTSPTTTATGTSYMNQSYAASNTTCTVQSVVFAHVDSTTTYYLRGESNINLNISYCGITGIRIS